MRPYKLSERVDEKLKAKGKRITLPPIEETKQSRTDYLKILRSLLREIARLGRGARSAFDFQVLGQTASALAEAAQPLVSKILRLEAERHTETFMATAKKTLGVDLSDVVLKEDLAGYLEDMGLRNAGLIKNLSADAVTRVQQTISTATINGTPIRKVQAQLAEQLRISDRRAQLIASDQMAKLNADLNRKRHEQAGITQYQWLTSRDERVRERHKSLEGKVYKYGQPTGAEGGLPPGQPIRCRCIAKAIVEF